MSSPILLVLGAGPNVGAKVARAFAKNGYKIAVAGRTLASQDGNTSDLLVKANFADPSSVKEVFDEVKTKLGVPNVVVYNAADVTFSPDPFAKGVSRFQDTLAVNVTSVYAAAKEAVAGFETLPADATKTFIYTGNGLNQRPSPALFDLGVGKTASAHMINCLSLLYADKGYRFYYADERFEGGAFVGQKISGDNHAAFYSELAAKKEQGPWLATFVGGKGYVDFNN